MSTCKQELNEALHRFYKGWKETYDAYVDVVNVELKEDDQASSFLAALNEVVYAALKVQLHNDSSEGKHCLSQ